MFIGYTISLAVILYLALFFDKVYAISLILHVIPLSILIVWFYSYKE